VALVPCRRAAALVVAHRQAVVDHMLADHMLAALVVVRMLAVHTEPVLAAGRSREAGQGIDSSSGVENSTLMTWRGISSKWTA
jgi:hypothetical protein